MKARVLEFREVDREGFEDVRSGLKVIETRAAKSKYQIITEGDNLEFVCGDDTFTKKVLKKYYWPSIDAMLAEIPFKKIMPRIESVEEMKKIYASYPNYDKEIPQFGLLGFELE
ncbi:MAG: hypothetical protein G01um101456_149 [Parcubacteria group bacterium Gr01-1014_56]|nr:MAG: hypothetical protein G01um101456_149 [Parcubacteria group bacterium Gr01-1014_56]